MPRSTPAGAGRHSAPTSQPSATWRRRARAALATPLCSLSRSGFRCRGVPAPGIPPAAVSWLGRASQRKVLVAIRRMRVSSPTEHSPWGWASAINGSRRAICSGKIRKGSSSQSRATEAPVIPNEKGFCSQMGRWRCGAGHPPPRIQHDCLHMVWPVCDGRGPIMVYLSR